MEQINQVALRYFGNNEASTQLTKQPENLDSVWLLMKQMKANYPNQELPPGTAESWMGSWSLLVREYGLTKFQQSLEKLLTHSKFFPGPAEIREQIEDELDREREQRSVERGRARLAEMAGWRKQWLLDRSTEEGVTVEELEAELAEKERSKREAEAAEAKKKRDQYQAILALQAKRAQERLDAERARRRDELPSL